MAGQESGDGAEAREPPTMATSEDISRLGDWPPDTYESEVVRTKPCRMEGSAALVEDQVVVEVRRRRTSGVRYNIPMCDDLAALPRTASSTNSKQYLIDALELDMFLRTSCTSGSISTMPSWM
jgi:hypothetical protein